MITLIGAGLVFTRRRGGLATVVVTRVLSVGLSVGAFADSTAPTRSKVVVGIAIVLTVAGVALVAAGRRSAPAGAEA